MVYKHYIIPVLSNVVNSLGIDHQTISNLQATLNALIVMLIIAFIIF